MNISPGDTSLMVRYIQAFLQENYVSTMRVSGIYDEYTHEHLVNYISTPNVENAYIVSNTLIEEFPELGLLFTMYFSPDEIEFTSKTKSQVVKDFIQSEETYNEINVAAQSMGWKIKSYISSENSNTEKFKIILSARNFVNIIPNRDLLPMLNLFNNKYITSFGLTDDGARSGLISELEIGINDDRTKLSYTEVEPDTIYSIYHGYPGTVELTIGCYSGTSVGIENVDPVENVQSIYLAPGEIYHYTTTESDMPNETKLLLIQVPWARAVEGTLYSDLKLKLGDFNSDGNIDYADFYMLCICKYPFDNQTGYAYYFENEFYEDEEHTIPITHTDDLFHTYKDIITENAYIWDGAKYLFVQDYDEYKSLIPGLTTLNFCTVSFTNDVENPTIDDIEDSDITILENYLDGTAPYLQTDEYNNPIWYKIYTNELDNSKVKYSNVIGITKGDFESDYIPTDEFIQNHWSIHSKFIDFITLNAITPYSAEYDIRTIQQMLDYIIRNKGIRDEEGNQLKNRGPNGIYTDELKQLVLLYQKEHNLTFRTGYVDSDTESILSKEAEEYKLYGDIE